MEDESVAQDVELDQRTVKARVQQLNRLFNELQYVYQPRLQRTRELQNTSTWTGIPATARFRVAMQQTLDDADAGLRRLWETVQELCTTLEQNARDLAELDEATRESITRLVKRAGDGLDEPDGVRPVTGQARPDTDAATSSASSTASAPATASSPAGTPSGGVWDGSSTP